MKTIAVIGGDLRNRAAAKALSQQGFGVQTFGLFSGETGLAALQGPVLLLGLPCCREGRLSMPLYEGQPLSFEALLEAVQEGQLIFGGNIPLEWHGALAARGARVVDYLQHEPLTLQNAYLTAEAALGILLSTTERSLLGAQVLLLGMGRISKALCPMLRALFADVVVLARKEEQRAVARSLGCRAAPLEGLGALLAAADMVISTVPAPLLGEAELKALPTGCLLMELASKPGGIEPLAAKKLGLRLIDAQSLPGKMRPQSAGELIADFVQARLKEEEGRW